MSLLSKKKKKNNSIKGGERLFRHKLKTSDPSMNNRFLNKLPPLKGKGREGKKENRPQILHDVSFKTSQTAVALTKSKRREFRRIPPLYYLTVFFFLLFFFTTKRSTCIPQTENVLPDYKYRMAASRRCSRGCYKNS